MNRRSFLALLPASFLGLRFASAEDGEVTIPVEPCPCQCSNDDGVTWFECDEAGEPYPLFPEEEWDDGYGPDDPSPFPERVLQADGATYCTEFKGQVYDCVTFSNALPTMDVTTLPNTGTGSMSIMVPGYRRELLNDLIYGDYRGLD
jgi:hypothetical protein